MRAGALFRAAVVSSVLADALGFSALRLPSADFIKTNPGYLAKPNMKEWIAPGDGETYNRCHFWCVRRLTTHLIEIHQSTGDRELILWYAFVAAQVQL